MLGIELAEDFREEVYSSLMHFAFAVLFLFEIGEQFVELAEILLDLYEVAYMSIQDVVLFGLV